MHFPQIHGSPLSHAAGVTAPPEGEELNLSVSADALPLPGLRLPASASLPLASCWPRPQQLLHSDSIALTKSLPIAAQQLFPAGLALSVTFGDTSPKGRGFGRPHRFLYLFGELYVIMVLRPCPPIYSGGEVRQMPSITTFMLSVAANVASYYICKWLDGWFTGRKH